MSQGIPTVTSVTAEYGARGPFVSTPRPRISWTSTSTAPSWLQASAELRLLDDMGAVTASASVTGRHSVLVSWPFEPLVARERVALQVRVTGVGGDTSQWSAPVSFAGGFLADGEWRAPMIALADSATADSATAAQPALLRGVFDLRGEVTRAVLYSTSLGAHQVVVNGTDVDDELFKSGWTSYQWRLVHETTEVTSLLRFGRNVLGIRLAGAWYTEEYGFGTTGRRFYGDQPAAAIQLEIDYADGSHETVASGTHWRGTNDGPLRASGIYVGEVYDATREIDGWSSPEFDDTHWPHVAQRGESLIPEARIAPPVRRAGALPVHSVITTPSGKTLLDFGQNIVGHVRFTVSGRPGDAVTIRHAEVLENGELGSRPLRRAVQTDRYILAGRESESWEPEFTFHGFRYVEVEGWPGDLDPEAFEAFVVHSDLRRTGRFECSNPLVNRLHENVVWGMRGNFLSIPTDCPQRDERMGWTGDIQVFGPTASFLYDVDGFLASWLRDLSVEQSHNGGVVPVVVPNPVTVFASPVAAWGDAATIVPWMLKERYADTGVVAAQYPSMKSWVETVLAACDPKTLLWESDFQFGDWLDPDAPPDLPGRAKTHPDIVASAHVFRSVTIAAQTARMLGITQDAERFENLAPRIRQAFLDAYVTPSGRMVSDAPTAYSMAIVYRLATDEELVSRLGDRLAGLVRASGYHISTGFVGTPIILDALTATGHTDVAERLLLQTENPSWLYPVTMGATTIWERWDSRLEDGTINPGEMTSFNHYAFGAVADWLHRTVAGLAPAGPGFRELRIAPIPLPSLEFAFADLDSPYGPVRSGWSRSDDGSVVVEALVPANATATVYLPDGSEPITIGSGLHSWTIQPTEAPPARPLVGWESSLASVVDDRDAYIAVMAAITTIDPAVAQRLRRQADWASRRTLGDSLAFVPETVRAAVLSALAMLNDDRRVP